MTVMAPSVSSNTRLSASRKQDQMLKQQLLGTPADDSGFMGRAVANWTFSFSDFATALFMDSVAKKVDEFFKISERESSISREIRSGVVSWTTASYIILVHPSIIRAAGNWGCVLRPLIYWIYS